MSGMEYGSRDADIDIGRLFGAIWRDKFKILIGALVLTALTFAILSTVTPKYESDARVLIESSESIYTRPKDAAGGDSDAALLDQQGVASQVQILTSSDLLLQVAKKLKLEERPEFDPTRSMSAFKSGLVALGLVADPSLVSSDQRVLDNVRERLQVFAVENSRVIIIRFRSRDKDLAAAFPNTLSEAYLDLEAKSQLDSTGKAASYLADEIKDLQDSVREAEAAVADYRNASDLQLGQNKSVLATQQLAEMSTELSRVRADRSTAEARASSVRSALDRGASLDSIPAVMQSPLIARLREKQIELNSQIADLSTTLLSGHPKIQALQSQLNDLSSRIRDEARKVLASLENEVEIARSREQELTKSLNQLKAASATANEREVKLRSLEREADAQRGLLESYLVRYREAQSRDEGEYAPAKARLISRAIVPGEPAFPRMLPLLGAAFFVSLLVMMLVSLMRELFSGRAFVEAHPVAAVRRREVVAVEEETVVDDDGVAVPVPAAAVSVAGGFPDEPENEEASLQPAAENGAAVANDNFGVSTLAQTLIEEGADRAIVVSPEGDGGAAASVELTRILAGEGLRSVLVDLSGSNAAGSRMLERPDAPGITDLLAATASYSDIIYPDFATNAHVIPGGLADPERAMRAADRLPIILDALVSAYDIVIVECGPADASGLRRLVGEGTRVVLSVVDPSAPEIVETAGNLVESGYEDLILVTPDDIDGGPREPEPKHAFAR